MVPPIGITSQEPGADNSLVPVHNVQSSRTQGREKYNWRRKWKILEILQTVKNGVKKVMVEKTLYDTQ